MNSLGLLLQKLEKEPIKFNNIAEFPSLLTEINKIFNKVKTCTNIQQAKDDFELLEKTQNFIARSICADNLEVPMGLWQFFKDFDRIDNQKTRIAIFNKIKNENYLLPVPPPGTIILTYDQIYESYVFKVISDTKIAKLAYFLVHDIGCKKIPAVINFISEKNTLYFESKHTYLLKNNNKIICGFVNELNMPQADTFEASISQLAYILDQWKKTCEKISRQIIITKDNGNIKVILQQ